MQTGRKLVKGAVVGLAAVGAVNIYQDLVKSGIIVPSKAKEKIEEGVRVEKNWSAENAG